MPNSLSSPSSFSVSIVLYHSPVDLLLSTLKSLAVAYELARSKSILERVSVYLVDNSESDDYRQSVETALSTLTLSEHFDTRYLASESNRGFGSGNNAVLEQIESDYHLILNPDVELEASALEHGISRCQDNDDIVLLSPRVTGVGGEQEFLCKRYPSVLVLTLRAFAPAFVRRWFARKLSDYEMRDVCAGDAVADTVLASGCFMLVRTSALRSVGGFDERFFLYFEDFDLSLRLGSLGRVIFDPEVSIVHHGGYAAGKGRGHVAMFMRSGIRFFNIHGWSWI